MATGRKKAQAEELIRNGVRCGRILDLERGIVYLLDGLQLLNPERDPRLALCAAHNLALYCAQLELPILARTVLERSARLYDEAGDPLMLARRRWLEGTVEGLQGELASALVKLREAVEELEGLGEKAQAEQVRSEAREVERALGETAAEAERTPDRASRRSPRL